MKIKQIHTKRFSIICIIFTLIISAGGMFVNSVLHRAIVKPIQKVKQICDTKISNIKYDYHNAVPTVFKQKPRTERLSRSSQTSYKSLGEFKITAYDLGYSSCGKYPWNDGYGITATGVDIRGKSYKEAKVVAVDPKIIKYGTKLYLRFIDTAYQIYNGIYFASDCGSAIKGNHIDLFLGDFNSTSSSKEALEFGITKARVLIIE